MVNDRRLQVSAKQLCRLLRRNTTESEKILCSKVRNRQLLGKKFVRQYPIFFDHSNRRRFFIADFYCHEHCLVVEVDGKSHDYQKDHDELRTYIIHTLGINVIRFKNEEIEKDIEGVLGKLKAHLLKANSSSQKGCSSPSLLREGDGG